MWKNITDGIAVLVPAELKGSTPGALPWRSLLADAAVLAAFALTSSWLMRG